MKRSTMLKKANKILASVMTASMLMSTVVPGTMVYATEISAPDVETEDGFTDGMEEMQGNPVTAESSEEEITEFDDGNAAAATATGGTIISGEVSPEEQMYDNLKSVIALADPGTKITLNGDVTIPKNASELKIDKSLTIDLAGHTIKGNGNGRIFAINLKNDNDTVTLMSSNEEKGVLTGANGNLGGAVYKNGGKLVIKNVSIENNTASDGGGIYNQEGSMSLINVDIKKNSAQEDGGGIYSYTTSINLKNVSIRENVSQRGSGIEIYIAQTDDSDNASAIFEAVTVEENKGNSGVFFNGYNFGSKVQQYEIELKKRVVICNNTNEYGKVNNLVFQLGYPEKSDMHIKVGTDFSLDSKIGVSMLKPTSYDKPIVTSFRKNYLNCFSSDKQNKILGIKNGDYGNLYIAPEGSTDVTVPSSHNWTYTVNGGTVTASCTDADCSEYPNGITATILKADSTTYSGENNTATVNNDEISRIEELTGAKIEVGEFKYVGTDGTVYESKEAPTNAGFYIVMAKVTIDGKGLDKEISVPFQIKKADPEIKFNENLTYNGSPLDLIESAPEGTEYKINDEGWAPEKPQLTEAGTYNISYRLNGDENHNSVPETTIEVTVKAAEMQVNENNPQEKEYNGEPSFATVSVDNPKDAVIFYKNHTDADTAYTTEPLEFTDAGEYTVDYKVEKENYKTVTGTLTVKITPRQVTVNGIEAEDKDYDGTANAVLNYDKVQFDNKVENDELSVTATGTFMKKSDTSEEWEPDITADTGYAKTVKLENLSLTGKSAKNYTLLTEDSQRETKAYIRRRHITVSITPNGGTYGSVTPATVTFHHLVGEEKVEHKIFYSGTAYNGTKIEDSETVPTDAGEYTVSVSCEGSYNYWLDGTEEYPGTAEFVIEPKEIEETVALVNPVKEDGTLDVTVADGKKTLSEGSDYTVETSKKDGIATITITGKGNYKGSIIRKVTVADKVEKGNIVTGVVGDETEGLNPSLKPVAQDKAKDLFSSKLDSQNKDEVAVKDIIDGKTLNASYQATLYLKVKEVKKEDEIVKDDVKKIEKLINTGKELPSDAKVGKLLDLKLFMSYEAKSDTVTYNGNKAITDAGDCAQEFTITIPKDMKTTASYTTRTYYVVCVHKEGNQTEVKVVPSTLNGDKLTFTATKFSTYAIAYKDTYYSPSYPVTGIKVFTDKVNLTKKGETAQVKVEITPSYADNKNLTWKSSDEKVATVDKDGKITAVGNGTATITVTSASGNYTATVTVTVNEEPEEKPVEIDKVTIDTETKTLTKIGESVKLNVKIEPENAENQKLTWKSDNEKVAVVDKDGKVTAVGNGTATITVTTEDGKHTATVTITVKASDEPAVNKTTSYGNLKARSVKQTNNSVTLEWSRVSGADGYVVYGNRCNGNGKTYKYQKLTTITNGKTRSWTQTGLKKGTYYKYIVKAYKVVNGKKVITDTSVSIHTVTAGGKYGVAKSVSVTKIGNKKNTLKVTLKTGKTAQITAKEVKKDKTIKHHRNLCYETSNSEVATVTPDGMITATGKGTCTVWVYAQNGVYRAITVTVK